MDHARLMRGVERTRSLAEYRQSSFGVERAFLLDEAFQIGALELESQCREIGAPRLGMPSDE